MSAIKPIGPEAERLTRDFLSKKETILKEDPHTGYHVYLRPDSSMQLQISIEGMGNSLKQERGCGERFIACLQQIKQWACAFFQWLFCCTPTVQKKVPHPIEMPPRTAEESAQGFEETRKTRNPLCEELTKHISMHKMYAIFSNSSNLLLIPDSRQQGVTPSEYPHLFALNAEQLRSVFSAILAANEHLKSEYDFAYRTNIAAHVGKDGSQTEGLLHIRFQVLTNSIKRYSPAYIRSLTINERVPQSEPHQYNFHATLKDESVYSAHLSLEEIEYFKRTIPEKIV